MRWTWWSGHATVVRPHPSSAPSSLPQVSSHSSQFSSITQHRQPANPGSIVRCLFTMAYNRGSSWLHHAAFSVYVHTARCLSITWRFHRVLSHGFILFGPVSKHFGPFLLSSVIWKGERRVTFTHFYIQVFAEIGRHQNYPLRLVIISFNSRYTSVTFILLQSWTLKFNIGLYTCIRYAGLELKNVIRFHSSS